jgi:hypothetical protein
MRLYSITDDSQEKVSLGPSQDGYEVIFWGHLRGHLEPKNDTKNGNSQQPDKSTYLIAIK